MRFGLTLAVFALLIALPAMGQDKIYSNSYMGKAPPAIDADVGDWSNVAASPNLEKLRGRVVYLEFSFIH